MKLGVIGLGARLAHMITVFRSVAPELRVVGVIDPNEQGAKESLPEEDRDQAVFYSSLDELVRHAKPDALAIGTRCDLHAPYAIEAAKYDLPLYLEKPVAHSMEQAVALEEAFESSGCEVVVSFPLRVSQLCRRARQLIDDNAIGRPQHLMSVNYVPYGDVYFDGWYRDYRITQGLFLQKATHDFDYLSHLAGAPVVRVGAMLSRGRVFTDTLQRGDSPDPDRLYYDNIGTPETGMNEDHSSAILEFANGAQGVYTQVFFIKRDAQARGATIAGCQGTISFDWYKGELRRVWHQEPLVETTRIDSAADHFGGDGELAKNFIQVIRGEGPSRATIHDGLQAVYTCLGARTSALEGTFQAVRQVGQVVSVAPALEALPLVAHQRP